jgi:1,4-alpha-glucan branching enzyme
MGYPYYKAVLKPYSLLFTKQKHMVQKTYFKTKDYAKVKFTISPENAETVAVLGLNGDWETTVDMKKKKDGSFATEVTLPKNSKHEFKYLVNAQEWLNEPEADEQVANAFGGSNSLILID